MAGRPLCTIRVHTFANDQLATLILGGLGRVRRIKPLVAVGWTDNAELRRLVAEITRRRNKTRTGRQRRQRCRRT